jgi:hypothetical protein
MAHEASAKLFAVKDAIAGAAYERNLIPAA